MKLRISPLLIAVPALLALGACQSSGQEIGGKPRESQPVVEYISLSPSTTELLQSAGIPLAKMLGRSESCDWPTQISGCPVVVKGTTPDFEKIASLKPQRVILEKNLYSDSTIQKLKDLGLDVLVVDIKTPKDYDQTVATLARDAGSETNASLYLDKVYGAKSLLIGSIESDMKLAVIIGDEVGGFYIAGKNTLLGQYVQQSSGEFLGPDSNKFEPVGIEEILRLDPNIIITQLGDGSKMLKSQKMNPIEAISKRNVLEVEPDVLLRNGGRVDQLLEGIATGIGRVERKGE